MKQILIVEDAPNTRDSLKGMLVQAGFMVHAAASWEEGNELAERHWADLAVATLDMNLDDSNSPPPIERAGAQIAIRLRESRQTLPPEFLIFSTLNEVDYYRLALRLRAAAYLWKDENSLTDVLRHVRVLALRHGLNGENPQTAAEVARIAVHSHSKTNAILEFCRGRLKEEFESCLGAQFLVLFTEKDKTRICTHDLTFAKDDPSFKLPDIHPTYHTLQALAHGKGNLATPFVLESRKLATTDDPNVDKLCQTLDGAAFLPLSLSNDLKLSIGILRDQTESLSTPNEAEALCTVLSQYLRPTVLENILTIWSQWTELRATLSSTARLCLSVGQELAGNLDHKSELESLAVDLRETGQYLTQLGLKRSQMKAEEISVSEVVKSEWQWIEPEDYPMEFALTGDCILEMQRSDLQIIVSRLLQWLAGRGKFTPPDLTAGIDVFCEMSDGVVSIRFEDRSERLDKELREELFAPFTQAASTPFAAMLDQAGGRYLPLYLAKMLVEGRYHGTLADHSDDITTRVYGHRILMQLPVSIEL